MHLRRIVLPCILLTPRSIHPTYEDRLDKRPAAIKRDWWKVILTQLEANGGVVTVIMNERLTRYTQSARNTETRKGYGDRRRSGFSKKKAPVAAAVPGEEEGVPQVVDDCAGVEGDFELQVLEEVNEGERDEGALACGGACRCRKYDRACSD